MGCDLRGGGRTWPAASGYLLDIDLAPGLALARGGTGRRRYRYGGVAAVGLANQPHHGAVGQLDQLHAAGQGAPQRLAGDPAGGAGATGDVWMSFISRPA